MTRGERGERGRRAARTPRPAPARPRASEDLVPRPSKMRYVALFLAGLFIGRLASEQFAPGPLGAMDLIMYVGLAFSVAWAWRSWARRAMIQRHLAAQRREQRAEASTADAESQ